MQIKVQSTDLLKTSVKLPSSKSISNRVLVINALSGNRGMLPDNVSNCDDTEVMIDWLSKNPDVVDIKAAGTAMRFSTALLAVTEGHKVITGSERMRKRPIAVLVDALRTLGADIEYVGEDGFPPLAITGNPEMKGGELSLPGGVSSQYISALLMIAPVMKEGLVLHLTGDVISRPYINLTLHLMREFGAEAEWTDDRTIRVSPVKYVSRKYFVESDWSAASYWYEMVALSNNASVALPGLFSNSSQGDSAVARFFSYLGVKTEFLQDDTVRISKSGDKPCLHLELDLVNQPDLAQTLVVTCCMMNVTFRFSGLQSLKIKETDRISALISELRKLGFIITEKDGSVLQWDGSRVGADDADPSIDTYEDHRMAMSFAPCAIKLGHILINNPEVVSKSYPGFWTDLEKSGFKIVNTRL